MSSIKDRIAALNKKSDDASVTPVHSPPPKRLSTGNSWMDKDKDKNNNTPSHITNTNINTNTDTTPMTPTLSSKEQNIVSVSPAVTPSAPTGIAARIASLQKGNTSNNSNSIPVGSPQITPGKLPTTVRLGSSPPAVTDKKEGLSSPCKNMDTVVIITPVIDAVNTTTTTTTTATTPASASTTPPAALTGIAARIASLQIGNTSNIGSCSGSPIPPPPATTPVTDTYLASPNSSIHTNTNSHAVHYRRASDPSQSTSSTTTNDPTPNTTPIGTTATTTTTSTSASTVTPSAPTGIAARIASLQRSPQIHGKSIGAGIGTGHTDTVMTNSPHIRHKSEPVPSAANPNSGSGSTGCSISDLKKRLGGGIGLGLGLGMPVVGGRPNSMPLHISRMMTGAGDMDSGNSRSGSDREVSEGGELVHVSDN